MIYVKILVLIFAEVLDTEVRFLKNIGRFPAYTVLNLSTQNNYNLTAMAVLLFLAQGYSSYKQWVKAN